MDTPTKKTTTELEDVYIDKKVIGTEHDDTILESINIGKQIDRIAILGSKELTNVENRNCFKSAIMVLHSMMSDKFDEQYIKEMKQVMGAGVGDKQSEIEKSFKLFACLKRLISRTPLQRKAMNIYETTEEISDDEWEDWTSDPVFQNTGSRPE